VRWVELLNGRGPDQFLELCLRGDDERLRAVVCDAVGDQFHRTTMAGELMATPFRVPKKAPSGWDFYGDPHSHRDLVSTLRGTARKNNWAFCSLWCGAQTLWLEHGYSFSTPACDGAETQVLELLTRASWLTVDSWSIEWGGQGYAHGVARSGTDAASLRAALRL
jgi:hypothetical protein